MCLEVKKAKHAECYVTEELEYTKSFILKSFIETALPQTVTVLTLETFINVK